MEELKKVHRVVSKALPGAPHAVWIVLDATTGQMLFNKLKCLNKLWQVDGVILTKLDSSAKGGMAFCHPERIGSTYFICRLG